MKIITITNDISEGSVDVFVELRGELHKQATLGAGEMHQVIVTDLQGATIKVLSSAETPQGGGGPGEPDQ